MSGFARQWAWAAAYALVTKYRCDLGIVGIVGNATAIRLALTVAHGAAFAGLEAVGVSDAQGLSYCRGGQGVPGQVITVSPVEATEQTTPACPDAEPEAVPTIFKSVRGPRPAIAATCIAGPEDGSPRQDHPAYIPRWPTRSCRA